MSGLNNGIFAPGIFHTKSLTPSKSKINRHQKIIDNNFIVTSIDEEAGIDQFSYDQFARDRYSDTTINQSSAIFCWGSEDAEVLKTYPANSKKFLKQAPQELICGNHFFQITGYPQRNAKETFFASIIKYEL